MRYWSRDSLSRKFRLGLIHAIGDGGGGGEGDNKWVEGLPESVRDWDEVKNSDSPEKFWDQITNQRSRMGRSITIPGEDAGDEDWKTFHAKLTKKVPKLMPTPDLEDAEVMDTVYGSLGRPEKADGYKLKEGQEQFKSFTSAAHKAGLNTKQFDILVKEFTDTQKTQTTEASVARQADHETLKTEWGNDYNRRMSVATTIATLTGAPSVVVNMLKDGKANAADYKWFFGLAQRFKGEGKNLMDDINVGKKRETPEEAAIKINEIKNNTKHPYWHKTAVGHKQALKTMRDLYQLKNAG